MITTNVRRCIIAGLQCGAAKASVKVLSDSGSGSLSNIVSGLNWVQEQHRTSGRPSVAVLPLSGAGSTALDNAVASLTNSGVHVVVSAGDQNTNIASVSPARVPSAITVGATTIADERIAVSNIGNITTHAPGQNILTGGHTSDTVMGFSNLFRYGGL
ncbi:hypothetical protein H1R20_g13758, partial [Candolleomyces eurysporus]